MKNPVKVPLGTFVPDGTPACLCYDGSVLVRGNDKEVARMMVACAKWLGVRGYAMDDVFGTIKMIRRNDGGKEDAHREHGV